MSENIEEFFRDHLNNHIVYDEKGDVACELMIDEAGNDCIFYDAVNNDRKALCLRKDGVLCLLEIDVQSLWVRKCSTRVQQRFSRIGHWNRFSFYACGKYFLMLNNIERYHGDYDIVINEYTCDHITWEWEYPLDVEEKENEIGKNFFLFSFCNEIDTKRQYKYIGQGYLHGEYSSGYVNLYDSITGEYTCSIDNWWLSTSWRDDIHVDIPFPSEGIGEFLRYRYYPRNDRYYIPVHKFVYEPGNKWSKVYGLIDNTGKMIIEPIYSASVDVFPELFSRKPKIPCAIVENKIYGPGQDGNIEEMFRKGLMDLYGHFLLPVYYDVIKYVGDAYFVCSVVGETFLFKYDMDGSHQLLMIDWGTTSNYINRWGNNCKVKSCWDSSQGSVLKFYEETSPNDRVIVKLKNIGILVDGTVHMIRIDPFFDKIKLIDNYVLVEIDRKWRVYDCKERGCFDETISDNIKRLSYEGLDFCSKDEEGIPSKVFLDCLLLYKGDKIQIYKGGRIIGSSAGYDKISPNPYGFIVCDNDRWGMIDLDGGEIIPMIYSSIIDDFRRHDSVVCRLCINGIWGYYSIKNKIYSQMKYKQAWAFCNGICCAMDFDRNECWLSEDLTEIQNHPEELNYKESGVYEETYEIDGLSDEINSLIEDSSVICLHKRPASKVTRNCSNNDDDGWGDDSWDDGYSEEDYQDMYRSAYENDSEAYWNTD